MSNLTLLLRFQRVGACNAAICIQIYDLLSRRGTDRQQDRERERARVTETERERGGRVDGRNTQHQATFHKAARRETPKQGHKLYYRASCIWCRSQS